MGVAYSGPFRITPNTADAPSAGVPERFDLRLAGANPVRERARLELAVPRRTPIDVRVHDIRGALVRTLATGLFEPGNHPLTWDGLDEGGRAAGPGVYFVRMSSGGRQVTTLRLVLVR